MDERVSKRRDRKNAPQHVGSSQEQKHGDMNMLGLSGKNCPFPGGLVAGGNNGTCGLTLGVRPTEPGVYTNSILPWQTVGIA